MGWSQTGGGAGVTLPLAVGEGGTGAETAAEARANLGLTDYLGVVEVGKLSAVFINSSSGWAGIGIGAPTGVGTASSVFANGKRWASYLSGTSASNEAGVAYTSGTLPLSTGQDWTLWLPFRTPASLSNIRAWIGALGTASSSDTAGNNTLAARFTEGTDTRLMAIGKATGSQTTPTAFGPALAVDTSYLLRIRFNAATQTAHFGCYAGTDPFGDFGTEVTVSTELPASTVNMGWINRATVNVGGTAVRWQLGTTDIALLCVPA